jgi:hypothetical protein
VVFVWTTICCILKIEKPKLWHLLIFVCPIFVEFFEDYNFCMVKLYLSFHNSSSSSSSFALRYPF